MPDFRQLQRTQNYVIIYNIKYFKRRNLSFRLMCLVPYFLEAAVFQFAEWWQLCPNYQVSCSPFSASRPSTMQSSCSTGSHHNWLHLSCLSYLERLLWDKINTSWNCFWCKFCHNGKKCSTDIYMNISQSSRINLPWNRKTKTQRDKKTERQKA